MEASQRGQSRLGESVEKLAEVQRALWDAEVSLGIFYSWLLPACEGHQSPAIGASLATVGHWAVSVQDQCKLMSQILSEAIGATIEMAEEELVADGHCSHGRDPEACEFCDEEGEDGLD